MTEQTLFTELIKDLAPFDRRLLFALDDMRAKQGSRTLQTSRFELFKALGLGYSKDNVKRLDGALCRLTEKSFFLPGPEAGFAIAKKAIARFYWEMDGEKLVISLGTLFWL
jgi:plasmid replication initiation protein